MCPTETDSSGSPSENPPSENPPSANSPSAGRESETSSTSPRRRAARILKGGAITFAVVGTGIAAWMADKWLRYPSMEASQFDFSAPLWPAATLFVLVATAAGVALLWQAARRSESGEDLFAQRHRRSLQEAGRRRSDEDDD